MSGFGIGSLVSGLGARKESRTYNKEAKKNMYSALSELTPEAMSKLMAMFYQHFMSQMNPQMQAAQQGLAANLGRSGMTQSGLGAQLRAGIPGQFSLGALNQAFNSALPIAQNRAGIRENRKFSVGPSGLGIVGNSMQDFENTISQWVSSYLGGGGGSFTKTGIM